MKKYYFFLIVIVTFILGLYVGKLIYNQPTKSLCIGIDASELGEGAVLFDRCIDNANEEDEVLMDQIWVMMLGAPNVEDQSAPRRSPDLHIKLDAGGVSYLFNEIWFTDNGAITGRRDYGSQVIKYAKELSEESADYLKQLIEEIE